MADLERNIPLSAKQSLAAAVNAPPYENKGAEKSENIQPREIAHALEGARQASRRQFGRLKDIEVEFVRSPARGKDFDDRHNRLLITRTAVEILLRGDPEELRHFRESVEDCGGFLLKYEGKGSERLRESYDPENAVAGGWLMAETRAVPVNDISSLGMKVLGADAQIYVPPDRKIEYVDEHAPLPIGSQDRPFEGDNIIDEIFKNPQIAMLIADIAAVPEWQKFGFAATCEDAAFMRVILEINRTRTNTIKYALAAVASIKGVQDAKHNLLTDMHDPGFRNLRSLLLHTSRRNRAPGVILGRQTGRTVPVELPAGEDGHLVVDWYLTAQPLRHMTICDDVKLCDEQTDY